MNIGDRVRIIKGASDWMKARRYWLDDMPESIDGLNGTVVADYTNLPGDDSHYGVDLGDGEMVGVNPMWLIPAAEGRSDLEGVVMPPHMPTTEELLAALPKTADGAPIIPGMMVYCLVGQHVDERKVIGPSGKMALNTFEPARHGAGPGQCHRLANTVYAVRENAIEAAKAV